MFDSIVSFFKRLMKKEEEEPNKDTAKERLHLVLMQDRANVSADFLEMMKQEIIEVIKKYIDVDENAIDVRLENKANEDGTTGAPALYANIPIVSIKHNEKLKADDEEEKKEVKENNKKETDKKETKKEENKEKTKTENANKDDIEENKKEEKQEEKEDKKEEEKPKTETKKAVKEELQEDKTEKEDKKEEETVKEENKSNKRGRKKKTTK